MLRANPEWLLGLGDLSIVAFEADEFGQGAVASLYQSADIRPKRRTPLFLGEAGENFDALVVWLLPCGTPPNGKFIRQLRLQRQHLAQAHSRHVALDRMKLSPELARRFGFHVVGVEMTGAAAEANHDHRFAMAIRCHRPRRLQSQEIRQRQPAQCQAASPQKAAARNAIAELLCTAVKQCQHMFLAWPLLI